MIVELNNARLPERGLTGLSDPELDNKRDRLGRLLCVSMTRAGRSVTPCESEPLCRHFYEVPEHAFEIDQRLRCAIEGCAVIW